MFPGSGMSFVDYNNNGSNGAYDLNSCHPQINGGTCIGSAPVQKPLDIGATLSIII